MALISIFAGVAVFTLSVGFKAWSSGMSRANVRQDGNLVLERMVREVSQAYSITAAEADKITFWADADGSKRISFETETGNLIRTIEGSGVETVLTHDAQTFALSYRDLSDNPMSLPSDVASQDKRDNIRVIIISLILNKGDETITLSSSVYVRNQELQQQEEDGENGGNGWQWHGGG